MADLNEFEEKVKELCRDELEREDIDEEDLVHRLTGIKNKIRWHVEYLDE